MYRQEKFLHFLTFGLFTAYLAVLVRIVLFKQAPLYNLFSATGSVERAISVIPYALALGSSDIDDLIFNTSGVMIGYLLYKIIRLRSHTDITAGFSTIVLVTVLGITALGVLFISHTELFMLSEKKVVVENEELIQDFIDLPPAFAGKLVEVDGKLITIEKNVHSATETRELIDLEISPKSSIFICNNKTDYFFSTISGEYMKYKQITYSDFINEEGGLFAREKSNVQIWSSDGNTVDHLIIFKSV
mgnify:CR=1 FL=1